jgi:hypothetical protein
MLLFKLRKTPSFERGWDDMRTLKIKSSAAAELPDPWANPLRHLARLHDPFEERSYERHGHDR